jgi:hypothetical protein
MAIKQLVAEEGTYKGECYRYIVLKKQSYIHRNQEANYWAIISRYWCSIA